MSPKLYIVAGPNGAGKTTFAREFLPNYAECLDFVNADLIAGGLSPFSPESAEIRAGRLMLEQISFLADRNRDFGFDYKKCGDTMAKKKKLSDIPLEIRAEEAMKKAIQKTIE